MEREDDESGRPGERKNAGKGRGRTIDSAAARTIVTTGMDANEFQEVVQRICAENGSYRPGAYAFVQRGLDYTLESLRQRGEIEGRAHISGPILLEGIREYALEQYGPLARIVLDHWGVHTCRDFGEIVFELLNYGMLKKTEEDRIEDFDGGYDFAEAFEQPFEPGVRS